MLVLLSDASCRVSETSNYPVFVNIHECLNMAGFSFREQAAMNFTYGHDAALLCQETFPGRKQPNHQTFAEVYRRLAQTTTLAPVTAERGRPRVAHTPGLEKFYNVIYFVYTQLYISIVILCILRLHYG